MIQIEENMKVEEKIKEWLDEHGYDYEEYIQNDNIH